MAKKTPDNKFKRLEAQLTAVKAVAEILLLVESVDERHAIMEAAANLVCRDDGNDSAAELEVI